MKLNVSSCFCPEGFEQIQVCKCRFCHWRLIFFERWEYSDRYKGCYLNHFGHRVWPNTLIATTHKTVGCSFFRPENWGKWSNLTSISSKWVETTKPPTSYNRRFWTFCFVLFCFVLFFGVLIEEIFGWLLFYASFANLGPFHDMVLRSPNLLVQNRLPNHSNPNSLQLRHTKKHKKHLNNQICCSFLEKKHGRTR